MIKLKPESGTYVAGATIPLIQVFNTNTKLSLSNNNIIVKEPGFVELIGGLNITATAAGQIAVNVLVDNNTVSTTNIVAAAVGDIITIPIYELFRVIPVNVLNGYANISLQLENAATISSGIITLKYIR